MTDNHHESLGRRIARMRLQHGMTQERLADIANVSAQAVSKWENDQSYPDIMLLPVLAKTFGVTVDELLGIATTGGQVSAPAQESTPEPEPEPGIDPPAAPKVAQQAEAATDADDSAARIRLHVIREGRDVVNLTIPLAVARIVINVMSYVPDRLIEGVDLEALASAAQNAGKGTLVDADDGRDHVTITLE